MHYPIKVEAPRWSAMIFHGGILWPKAARIRHLYCHILTEISRKFTRAALLSLFEAARLTEIRHYEPDNGYYSLALLRV